MARSDAKNSSRFWADPDRPGLSFIAADFTTHEYPRHAHAVYVFATTEQGSCEFNFRGGNDYARADSLIAIAPGQPHATRMGESKHWSYRGIYISTRRMIEIANALGQASAPEFTQPMLRDPELVARFREVHRAFEREAGCLEREARLYEAFELVFERHTGSAGSQDNMATAETAMVHRVVEIMHAQYAEDLSLEVLAASVQRSPFQLIRSFNRVMGLPPHNYLTQLRLWNAARMMRRGGSMADVAVDVGFYDQSALNKHFKRVFGITPLQYLDGMSRLPVPAYAKVAGPGVYQSPYALSH